MHFDPRFLFVALWGTQFVGHALGRAAFGPLEWMTWAVMVLAVASFLVGAQVRLAWGHHRSVDLRSGRAPAIACRLQRTSGGLKGVVPVALLAYALLAALTFVALGAHAGGHGRRVILCRVVAAIADSGLHGRERGDPGF